MTKKDVHVVPHSGGWATKTEGASRAGVVVNTQREAIERARDQALRQRVEVVIHRKDGTIRDSDSYGNDPNPPKDKKQ
jgi:uncharacterized protein YdaT